MANGKKKKLLLIYFSLPIILILSGIVLISNSNKINNGINILFTKLGASVSCPSGYTAQGSTCKKCSTGTLNSNGYCYKAATASTTSTYTCSEGTYTSYYPGYGSTYGVCLIPPTTVAPTYKDTTSTTVACPSGSTKSGTTCYKCSVGTYVSSVNKCIAEPTKKTKTVYSCSSGGSYKGYVTGVGYNYCQYNPTTTSPTSSGSGSGTKTSTKYTVTYCSDSNCKTKKTVNVTYGTKFNVLAYNTFTKTGYTNTKWKEIKNGSEVYWTIENTNNKNWKWDHKYNVVLYATWVANTYTIVFNKNNSDATGTMSNETMTYGTKKALTANKFVYKGRKFVKWTTNKDGTGTSYSNSQSVINLTTTKGGKINLYAQWEPITYTIAFNKNGGTGTQMSNMSKTFNVTKPAPECTYTKSGYVFAGWNIKSDGSGKNYEEGANIGNLTTVDGSTHTLYAQWVVDNDVIPNLYSNKYIVRKVDETPTTMRKYKVFKNAKMYTGTDKKTQIGNNAKIKTGDVIDIGTNINYITAVLGDGSKDGKITFEDVVLCYRYYKGKLTTKNEVFYALDAKSDQKIGFDDVTAIYGWYKGGK